MLDLLENMTLVIMLLTCIVLILTLVYLLIRMLLIAYRFFDGLFKHEEDILYKDWWYVNKR